MKILAISDIHGDDGLVKKLAKKAKEENVDIVILAGDLTWFGQPMENLVKPFIENKKEVFLIPGNHDDENMTKALEQVYKNAKDLHKKSIVRDGIGFFGSGTTDWGFYDDEKQVYSELKKAHEKVKELKKKIMIAHCPPQGSKIELMGYPGSRGVKKALDKFKPDVLICGHIHPGGGIIEKIGKTKIMNVSRKPIIFEI